jgi:hypothetical protein
MRYEVFFDTPHIWVGNPVNNQGPLPAPPVYSLTGTDQSYQLSLVEKRNPDQTPTHDENSWEGEVASWVDLLVVIQDHERISRDWDRKTTRRWGKDPEHEICVQIQRRTQSWSFVPAGVVKPYAFTTMTSLLEIVAMLGLHWVAFDQTVGNVIAEGSGMLITSALVQGLGLMVSFERTQVRAGYPKGYFEASRLIPSQQVKNFCFGSVPIFLGGDLPESAIATIELGSREEVTATLEFLGCGSTTAQRYQKSHVHLFSG